MVVNTEYVNVPVEDRNMRTFLAKPRADGKYPAVLFYSDIFQLTAPMLRACTRLAGYGFIVAAPEIYHRIEPAGTVIPFDDGGRTRGMENAGKTPVKDFDADCRAALDFLKYDPSFAANQLAAAGFCIGGHLAFRAALQPDIRATVCFYPTGVHNGKLGKDENAGSLEVAEKIKGQLLLIFGSSDPHVPREGREKIIQALNTFGTRYSVLEFPAEHAFMRDEGARYDPEATDQAWAAAIHFFRMTLSS